jgi:hypothetical protein
MYVVDDILSTQDLIEIGIVLVLLDFPCAFATMNTTVLLSKLEYYSLNSNT